MSRSPGPKKPGIETRSRIALQMSTLWASHCAARGSVPFSGTLHNSPMASEAISSPVRFAASR